MSEQKQTRVAVSIDKGMVVGHRRSRRYRTHIKAWLIGLFVIVVLGILWCAGYYVTHRSKDHNRSANTTQHFSSLNAVEQAASHASDEGNFKQALADLQSGVAMATTRQKVDLYAQLASAAQNSGNPTLAVEYYQQRHLLDPSTIPIDSYSLGNLYQLTNQKSQAVSQYKLYVQYVQAHPAVAAPYSVNDVISPINSLIQSLEAQQ